MKRKYNLIPLFILCLSGMAFSQKATIKGTVSDGEIPIPGASVQIVGTTKATAADDNGNFTLTDIDAGAISVKISSVGFSEKTQNLTLKAGESYTLNVNLSEGSFLDAVVVTGLSINAKQKELGTSRASMSGETLKSLPAPTIESAMVGRMAGVEAYTADGAPGGGYRFRIRGGNSLLGASEPLVIIDGIIMDNSNRNNTTGATGNTGASSFGMNNGTRGLNSINPNDIETIEVLKGAAAASLYGSRASAGVIVVKTKSGGNGKLKVNYGLDLGVASLSRGIDNYKTDWSEEDVDQWVGFQNARLAATSQISDAEKTQYKANVKNSNVTNWAEKPFQNGLFQRHTLNLQGGTRKFGYYATLNNQNTEGHIRGTEFNSKGGRISLTSAPIDRLSIRVNAAYNKDFRTQLPGGTPGFFIPNRWTVAGIVAPFMRQEDQRPAFLAGITNIKSMGEYARIQKQSAYERFHLSGNANYKITDNLSIDVNAGIDSTFIDGKTIYPVGVSSLFAAGRLDFDKETLIQKTVSTGLNHLWTISDKFYIKSAIGTQYDENSRKYFYKRFQTYNPVFGGELDTIAYSAPQPGSVLNFNPIVRTLGIYVNETFGIGKKLFLNIGGRADRSTSYIDKYFFYPRASLSYQILDNIRVRGAYGTSGIQPPPYQINLTYLLDGAGYNGTGFGYRFNNPGNKDLKPEQQTEIEFGVDGSFFDKRLGVELTYYNKTFKDMLFNASVAPDINNGFTRFVRNIAEMYNRGFEFSFNANVIKAQDWNVNVGGNLTTLDNKITKLNDPVRPEIGSGITGVAQLRPDFPISGFYASASPTSAFIGTALPKYEGSVNIAIAYKNFTLLSLYGGKGGYYKFNTTDRDLADPTIRFHTETWNLPLDQATAKYNDLTQWIQKADFLKLRQLALTYNYTPPVNSFIKTMTFGVVGSNLITWSGYKGGYDVEAETSGSGGQNAWMRGVDAWEAGAPRQWTFSFNIGF
jgi:TonB-dependent starch-binding outer membrane protein SusC